MEYIVVFAVLLLSLGFTFYPLFRPGSEDWAFNGNPRIREGLEYDKNALYQQIIELDFDHDLGNIEESDYEMARNELKSQAAGVIARLNAGEGEDLRCSACGEQLAPNDKFCPFCGQKQA